jgi:hypothetical protein
MEREDSLLLLQELASDLYSEPEECSPYPRVPFRKDSF